MPQPVAAEERQRLADFFVRYGNALATGDLPGISGCYDVPALVLHDRGAKPIAAHAEIEADFDGAAERHRAQGLVEARPTILNAESLTEVLISADVHWDYRDDAGESQGQDGYRYVLRRTSAGPRIQIVIATPPLPKATKAKATGTGMIRARQPALEEEAPWRLSSPNTARAAFHPSWPNRRYEH